MFPRVLIAGLVAVLAACGGDSPTQNTPSITLSVSGQSLTLAQGSSGTLQAAVVRTSFDGAVTLSAEGAPSGLTVSFNPASLSGSVNASTITFAAGASLASGTYPVTIRASGSGVTSQTQSVSVTVTATGGFSLSVAPTSVTMAQGAGAAATVNIARSGSFTAPVNLTVTGAPTGMTVTVTPTSATGATAALAITAGAATPVGTHTLTIRGNATGMGEQTVTLSAVVTAASAGTQVTLPFCANELPIWFAYQNEGGAWTQVTASAANSFTFTLTGAKAGIAMVSGSSTVGYDTEVIYGTTAEFQTAAQALAGQHCSGGTTGKTLNGSVAGLTVDDVAEISMSGGFAAVYGSNASQSFTLTDIADGARDLVATRLDLMGDFAVDKVIVRRALNLASGTTMSVLDFNGAEAVAPATATATVTGVGATDDAAVFVGFQTANGTLASFGYSQLVSGSATVRGVPSSKVIAGDLHQLFAYAASAAGTSERYAVTYNQQLAARTLALGPEVAAPTISTLSASTPVRLRAVVAVQTDYAGSLGVGFTQSPAADADWRAVYVQMSAGYRGTATSWDIAIPDFGTAAGYNATWGLKSGVQYAWDVFAQSGSITSDLTPPTDGQVMKFAARYSASAATPNVQGAGIDRLREPVRHRKLLQGRFDRR